MKVEYNYDQKTYKKLRVLLFQLEIPVWKSARKWSYSGHFALEEGLKANGVEPFIIPAMSGIPSSSPLSWLSRAQKLCKGKRFDQVWITLVHSPYEKVFLDWISTLAPVRLGWICESLEYLPEELLENPGLKGRKELVLNQLKGITHVVACDENDVDLINNTGLAKATLWASMVPERLVSKQYIPPKNNTTAFFGLQYGKRKKIIQHPALQGVIAYPPPPEDSIYYGRLFDDLQKTTFADLKKNLPVHENTLKQYVDKLRIIRQGEFAAWIEGLKEWNAVINLPSYVKAYTGRIIENMAAGRPVISWNIPDRPRVKSHFEDGKEILLFDQNEPLQLAEHIRHIQQDPDFARLIAENARSKILRYHTTETGIRQILDWIETGENPEYNKTSEHLNLTSSKSKISVQKKIDQGEALFAEGKIEEAEICFLEILNKDPINKEAYNNLGVLSFQRQDTEQALEYFTKVLEIDPFHKDAILNYSALLKSANQFHESEPILEKAMKKFPDDQEISQLLNEVRQIQRPGTKIAVLCLPGLQSFLGDIVEYLKTGYDVRTCYSSNKQEIESNIHWADIVWLEWGNELAVALTTHPTILNGKRVICRLHSYEAFAGYAAKIKWEKISDLIFVAKHIKNIILQQAPSLSGRIKDIHIAPNGVNLSKFSFKQRARGKNLAYVGNINYKKGPMLLLHAFRELVQKDNEYRLFIAGNFQDARYELYFNQMIKEMNLANNIQLDGWVNDICDWLEDKQYIVCTSVLEGHPVGLMEAMARGLKPVIHNFVEAKGIYPEQYLWNTIPEFVNSVTGSDYDSREYRLFIKNHYSLQKQLKTIARILQRAHASVKEEVSCNSNCQAQSPKEFYDNFLDYLKRDRERPNPRHEYIKKRLDQIIQPGKEVLDLGCGIGITTEHIVGLGAKKVVGVDLSSKLISFAKKSVPQAKFIEKDITKIELNKTFDVITLVDVIEHIPEERYEDLFATLELHAHEKTIVYLSVPDPQWIEFVRTHRPEKLQIIDNCVHNLTLLELSRKHGFILYFFNTYGIDVSCQYNEYILTRETSAPRHMDYAKILKV